MEQFKQLNWSWNRNYKEDEGRFPRTFDFNSINQHDILNRTINEVHKAILLVDEKYELFKCSGINFDDVEGARTVNEVKDPRRNSTKTKLSSKELIKNHRNFSNLTRIEQTTFFNDLMGKQKEIEHNPELLNQKRLKKNRNSLKLFKNIIDKRAIDVEQFQKSAEIDYYRNLDKFKVDEDMKKFLCNKFNSHQSDTRYTMITMILRDQKTNFGEITKKIEKVGDDEIEAPLLAIKFPCINKLTSEELDFFSGGKKWDNVSNPLVDVEESYNVFMSASTLYKLFIDTEEFHVKFYNSTLNGKTITKFKETFPLNPMKMQESLQTLAELSLKASIEIDKFQSFMESCKISAHQQNDYKISKINDFFSNFYGKFKRSSCQSRALHRLEISTNAQKIEVLYENSDGFYFKDETTKNPIQISIKLEFQTEFGAERMSKCELLHEWCLLTFFPGSQLMRLRIDAMTFTIISKEIISIEEISKELFEAHQINPNDLLSGLFNVLLCVNRLPTECEYLIETKVEDSCKKLLIYKECENGKMSLENSWEIQSNFVRKWVKIDENLLTFLHLNHEIPSCCFVTPCQIRLQKNIKRKPEENVKKIQPKRKKMKNNKK